MRKFKSAITKIFFLCVWAVPLTIGFVAAAVWQGLVIGWAACMELLEET